MAERDLADNLAVYPLLYSRCVLLGGLGGDVESWRGSGGTSRDSLGPRRTRLCVL